MVDQFDILPSQQTATRGDGVQLAEIEDPSIWRGGRLQPVDQVADKQALLGELNPRAVEMVFSSWKASLACSRRKKIRAGQGQMERPSANIISTSS